jgi:hypothetical protein
MVLVLSRPGPYEVRLPFHLRYQRASGDRAFVPAALPCVDAADVFVEEVGEHMLQELRKCNSTRCPFVEDLMALVMAMGGDGCLHTARVPVGNANMATAALVSTVLTVALATVIFLVAIDRLAAATPKEPSRAKPKGE